MARARLPRLWPSTPPPPPSNPLTSPPPPPRNPTPPRIDWLPRKTPLASRIQMFCAPVGAPPVTDGMKFARVFEWLAMTLPEAVIPTRGRPNEFSQADQLVGSVSRRRVRLGAGTGGAPRLQDGG